MDLELLPAELGAAIVQAAQAVADGKLDDQFVVDIFQTGSGTSTNMNTNEVIAGRRQRAVPRGGARAASRPIHPNDAVNMGQSSNDVIPTAIHVAALEGIQKRLIPALEELARRCSTSAPGRSTPSSRSAGPTSRTPCRSGSARSSRATPRRSSTASAGSRRAPSRSASWRSAARPSARGSTRTPSSRSGWPRMLSHDTGLEFRPASNRFEAMANRDAAVEASGALKTVAISLSNIANNIRWLASGPRCGIGEIRIPELQPGSSIMPAKVNPVIPEAVMMVAAQVVGNDATIAWANALGSNFDLNVMMPVIAYNLLQSIELLANAAQHLAEKCVDADEVPRAARPSMA